MFLEAGSTMQVSVLYVWLFFHITEFYNKKFIENKSIIIIHLYSIYNLFVNMINILTHTKQLAFHAPITSGVYSVGFDVFTFSRPRRRPVC